MDETETSTVPTDNGGEATQRLTHTVPEAGRMLGVGRSAAYEAARRGDIPTIRIGRRILVPDAALRRKLMECEA